ncbi:hypothetical protein [Spiroplasma endosymbiont of Diplazon laetatorius]
MGCTCDKEYAIYELKCDFCKLLYRLLKLTEALDLQNKIELNKMKGID